MNIEWSSSFEIGVEWVDSQHRYFISLIQRVQQQLRMTEDTETILRLLEELQSYMEFHFISEENFAASLGVNGLSLHQERHAELRQELERNSAALRANQYTPEEYINFLYEWLLGHTLIEDKKLFSSLIK